MEVDGRAPDGRWYRVEVGVTESVRDLVQRLSEASGARVHRVRLGERYLLEGELCSDVGMVAECVVDFEEGLRREEVDRYIRELDDKELCDLPLEARRDKEVV
eukprot:Sspe_Gene.96635::Locus_69576_Transcript_1_3_Confidence_0.818_Length_435::g.96635::m.96635